VSASAHRPIVGRLVIASQNPGKLREMRELLARYGVTSNAIAPSARTRMTEGPFAERMKVPEAGFDVMHPGNIAPLVAWLCSAESQDVTGHVFEIAGGELSVADGWRPGPKLDKGARWAADEIGAALHDLLRKATPAQKVYGS